MKRQFKYIYCYKKSFVTNEASLRIVCFGQCEVTVMRLVTQIIYIV